MDFFDLLKRRCSARSFTQEPIPQEAVSKILLAANSAPVGSSMYKDLRLTAVKDRGLLDKLSVAAIKRIEDRSRQALITREIKPEALPPKTNRDPFYGAPLAIFVSHRKQSLQPGIEFSNVACVALSMQLAATELGLGSVFIWGVLEAMRDIPELDNTHLLNLPEGFEPLLGIAIGYRAKDASP
ncbi:MAG: nitroreductase family protein, partial [Clostridiales bacterium]|nr:nitroreductase family protein [Clostridiales bacterium]